MRKLSMHYNMMQLEHNMLCNGWDLGTIRLQEQIIGIWWVEDAIHYSIDKGEDYESNNYWSWYLVEFNIGNACYKSGRNIFQA